MLQFTDHPILNPDSIPACIGDHLGKQMIAYQRFMDSRDQDIAAPTLQDMAMQSKLLTNIIKIKKFNATDVVAKAMKQFFGYIHKQDKQQAKKIAELYLQFKGVIPENEAIETDNETDATETKIEQIPELLEKQIQEVNDINPEITPTNADTILLPIAAQEPFLYPSTPALPNDEAPFTEAFYQRNKIFMKDVNYGTKDTTYTVENRGLNKQWLEYNLYQYTLPTEKRRFVKDPDKYHQLIDHKETIRLIKVYYNIR